MKRPPVKAGRVWLVSNSSMKYRRSVAACAAACVLSMIAASAQESPRELLEGQPIAKRLLPTDKVVIVRPRGLIDELPPPPPSVEGDLSLLRYIDEVLIVRQVQQKAELVENGRWINTQLRATVTQVLKTKSWAAVPGMTVKCEMEGGEKVIHGVMVRAGLNPSFNRPQYLFGVRFHPDLKIWQLVRLYEIDDDQRLAPLRSLTGVQAFRSALYGVKLDEVVVALSKQ